MSEEILDLNLILNDGDLLDQIDDIYIGTYGAWLEGINGILINEARYDKYKDEIFNHSKVKIIIIVVGDFAALDPDEFYFHKLPEDFDYEIGKKYPYSEFDEIILEIYNKNS